MIARAAFFHEPTCMNAFFFIASTSRTLRRRITAPSPHDQRGAGLLELAIACTLTLVVGMATLQFGMLYLVRHHFNHAVFMAARAGASAHANIETIHHAYIQAMVPLVQGGQSFDELSVAQIRAKDMVTGRNDGGENPHHSYARIVLENPTRESFSNWNSPLLQYTIGGGSRVIPHSGQGSRWVNSRSVSSQSFREANQIRLRVIQGYQPTVPWMGWLTNRYLAIQDSHRDATYSDLLGRGLIPLVFTVTLPMQSDAIERLTVPHPGVASCTSVNYPDGCLPAKCRPGDVRCDPVCKPPFLCSMPELPKD
ncbi:MAG: hypothetical protein ACI9ZF_000464 [Bradyrhizobium sp.]